MLAVIKTTHYNFMKILKILSLISLTFLLSQILFSQSKLDNQLKELSKQHQFVSMDSLNSVLKNKDYYFYKARFANVCNNPSQSNKYLDSLKDSNIKSSFEYLGLKNDNYVKMFNYKMAFETSKQLTNTFSKKFTKEELEDELNTQKIWQLLRQEISQKINEFASVTVNTKKDLAGLTTINVKGSNADTNFFFDTGAGLSCITESIAKKYNVKIVSEEKVLIQSFTGQMCSVNVGIAPILRIGNIIVENAVFLVYPDSSFSFANGAYVINGIIGFPIAKELGTITIEENTLTFSKLVNINVQEKNLFVDQLRAIVTLTYKGKKLPFNFDSGAQTSLFTKAFYESFKEYIDLNGFASKRNEAGAGGNEVEKEIIELSDQVFWLNSKPISLKKMSIDKNDYGIYGKVNFGNIGQDFIGQYKKIIISFDNNYLQLEN
jgi:hypothetical protein